MSKTTSMEDNLSYGDALIMAKWEMILTHTYCSAKMMELLIKSTYQDPLCTLVRSTDGGIPIDPLNSDYIQYLMDVKKNGISIASCDECGDGVPNDSMWHFLPNAEDLLVNKYIVDKLNALRGIRYEKTDESRSSLFSKFEGFIETYDPIKKYNIPMRQCQH